MVSPVLLKSIFFGLLLIAVLLGVAGDVLFKKWALGSRNVLLILGLLVYFIGTVFWAVSLKYEFLSKAISVFTIMNLVLVVLVGVVIFKEDLTLLNKLGIILGIVSVVMIEI